MSKHTPGPWTITSNKIDGNGYHLASINASATTEGKANARLIASAPELLNAVRFLLSNHDNRISKADRDAAYAAIAKATGQ